MVAHVDAAIEWKRREPADDLLSALIAAEEEGDRLSPRAARPGRSLLFIAGHETTVNLIGNGTLALLRHPDQLALLRDDPTSSATRSRSCCATTRPCSSRAASRSQTIEIDGAAHRAPARSSSRSSAPPNHDPEHFGADADELDLTRRDAPHHISFGGGIHHCLGAVLARAEAPRRDRHARAAASPSWRSPPTHPAWNGRMVLRGLDALPVTLS